MTFNEAIDFIVKIEQPKFKSIDVRLSLAHLHNWSHNTKKWEKSTIEQAMELNKKIRKEKLQIRKEKLTKLNQQ